MRLHNRILNRIDRNIGSFGIAFFGSSLFLLYGTLISICVNTITIINHSYKIFDHDPNTNYLIKTLLSSALILAVLLITISFVNLSVILSRQNRLPHLLDGITNHASFLVGLPCILILSFFQQYLCHYDNYNLFLSIIFSITACVCTYLFSLVISLTARSRKSLNKFTTVLLSGASVLLLLGIIGICTALIVYYYYYANFTIFFGIFAMLVAAVGIIFNEQYYIYIRQKLAISYDEAYLAHPTKIHSFVLVSKINKPAIRAISFAKAVHKDVEILAIGNDNNSYCENLKKAWIRSKIPVPLRIYNSPSNNVPKSALKFFRSITLHSKRELIVIYIPHYTSKHFFERIMHNQISRKIEHEVKYLPNVAISTIPWQRL